MATRLVLLFVAGIAAAGSISFRSVEAVAAAQIVYDDSPRYDAQGRLIAPERYREWVFLSAGLDMNYDAAAATPTRHVFGNVFAPRAAYAAFQRTGRWPDKTVLIVENRLGSTKGSINKSGQFQTGVVNLEAHVKDIERFKGGWGFFGFEGRAPADLIPANASCYACHRDHAAVDTTFVQFYPTLLPIAMEHRTLSPAYSREALGSR